MVEWEGSVDSGLLLEGGLLGWRVDWGLGMSCWGFEARVGVGGGEVGDWVGVLVGSEVGVGKVGDWVLFGSEVGVGEVGDWVLFGAEIGWEIGDWVRGGLVVFLV